MAGAKEFMISIILLVLFSIAIFGFGESFQRDNGVSPTILDNARLNNTNNNLTATIVNFNQNSSSARQAFDSEQTPQSGIGALSFSSVISAAKTYNSLSVTASNVIFPFIFGSLGIPPIVFTAIITIILIIVLLIAWRLIKAGE